MPRSLTIPISSGSDPEPIEIDDSHEAIGEIDTDDFGDVIELCDKSPTGQCEYSILDPVHCMHCGKGGGM